MVFPHSITFEHMQITFVTPVHPSCLSSWTQCHLCRPGCSMHRPTVTRVTPLFHLFVWHFGGTAWCLVLLRKEGDKIEKSFLLSFVSLCLARLDPPHPLCPSVHLSEEQGEEEVGHAGTPTLTRAVNKDSAPTQQPQKSFK